MIAKSFFDRINIDAQRRIEKTFYEGMQARNYGTDRRPVFDSYGQFTGTWID